MKIRPWYEVELDGVLLKRGKETERKKERNGKRNETENEMKVSKENKYMNFVDTTANKGKRFKIKQKLDFNSDFKKNETIIFNVYT